MGRVHRAVVGGLSGATLGLGGCGGTTTSAPPTASTPGGVITGAGGPATPTQAPTTFPATGPADQPTTTTLPVTGPQVIAPSGSGASGGAGGSAAAPAAGTAGGVTAPDPCAGLVPATPSTPIEIAMDLSDIPFCHLPTSDGTGTAVALGIGLHHMGFDVYPMSGGTPVGSFRVDHQDTGPVYDAIAPSVIGFHAAVNTGPESVADRGDFTAYDDHGAPLTTATHGTDGTGGTAGLDGDVRLLKPDPAGGGTALLTLSGPLMTPTYHVEFVDAGGHRTASTALDRAASDLAVATDGHVLVTAVDGPAGTAWKARWLDHDAKPLTDWFDFQLATQPPQSGVMTYVVLEPLADGAIALREGQAWTLVFGDATARADPAPAWLSNRPGTDVFVIDGGKAMAVAASGSIAACPAANGFEVLAPAGQSCGQVALSTAAGCSHVTFGRDGTAFTLSVGASQTAGNQRCTYRWWPGLVR